MEIEASGLLPAIHWWWWWWRWRNVRPKEWKTRYSSQVFLLKRYACKSVIRSCSCGKWGQLQSAISEDNQKGQSPIGDFNLFC